MEIGQEWGNGLQLLEQAAGEPAGKKLPGSVLFNPVSALGVRTVLGKEIPDGVVAMGQLPDDPLLLRSCEYGLAGGDLVTDCLVGRLPLFVGS